MRQVIIHTDGSCWPNPGGPGGWGAVILSDGVRSEHSGSLPPPSTNNRAELTAAVEALRVLSDPSEVDLYTDSQYLRNGAAVWSFRWRSKNWRGVKNSDLWIAIADLCEQHRIRWHWVRGHATCPENIRCDYLAEKARNNFQNNPCAA